MKIKIESLIYAAIACCMFCLGYLIAPDTIETKAEPDTVYIYNQETKKENANMNNMYGSIILSSNNAEDLQRKLNKELEKIAGCEIIGMSHSNTASEHNRFYSVAVIYRRN